MDKRMAGRWDKEGDATATKVALPVKPDECASQISRATRQHRPAAGLKVPGRLSSGKIMGAVLPDCSGGKLLMGDKVVTTPSQSSWYGLAQQRAAEVTHPRKTPACSNSRTRLAITTFTLTALHSPRHRRHPPHELSKGTGQGRARQTQQSWRCPAYGEAREAPLGGPATRDRPIFMAQPTADTLPGTSPPPRNSG